MTLAIAILEDNSDRRAAMRTPILDRIPQYETVFFRDAMSMQSWLVAHLQRTLVISLDHDLDPVTDPVGRPLDPGTGRDVVNFLAGQPPQCPIVIHTSNGFAGDGMELALRDAGWTTHRVVPHEDLAWIADWFLMLRRAILDQAQPSATPSTSG